MRLLRPIIVVLTCAVLMGVLARPAGAQSVPGWNTKQFTFEQIDAERIRLMRDVEIEGETGTANAGQKFFADDLEMNIKTGELTASGNVVFQTPTSRIAAETAVFNTKTKLGTFTNATGIAQLGARGLQNQSMFGTLEPDVYFYGTTIEKIAADKYRINKGGFTTCVQPTPRWQIVSGRATVNLNDYVVMRNAIVRVKDVPVFYLPILYYPIQEDDRASGILMPTYSTSTYSGSSISNGVFWAINRSQDLTLFYDWFFRSSTGAGAEYRYLFGPTAQGSLRFYALDEQASVIEGFARPARQSKIITGRLTQGLPLGLSARGNVDYSTDIATQQLYSNDFVQATTSRRTINGSIAGAWAGLSVNSVYVRDEYFYTATDSQVSGASPGVAVAYSGGKLPRVPVYLSVNANAGRVLYINNTAKLGSVDQSVTQLDLLPSIRAPLSTLPFLSVNATLSYRVTHVNESLASDLKTQVKVPVTRRYADMGAEVVGPVLTRVFSPNNAFASRLKHIIEPYYAIQRRTELALQDFFPVATAEKAVGGTQMSYGLANRMLVRKDVDPKDSASAARELLNVSVRQSYYTDNKAGRYDPAYTYSYLYRPPTAFSPISLAARAAPVVPMAVDFRLEYDPRTEAIAKLVGFGLNGSYITNRLEATAGWSQTFFGNGAIVASAVPATPGSVTPIVVKSNNYISQSTKLQLGDGRFGGTVSFNYDLTRSTLVNHRYIGFYNAQCCGISVEYTAYNYGSGTGLTVPQNRRFNMSFTLAGVGSFSNFFGSFGGGS